jgi:Flp pilus assembly protein TadG
MKTMGRCNLGINTRFVPGRIEASSETIEEIVGANRCGSGQDCPTRLIGRRCAQTEGGAILEFALMLPILALIMMGILTFGVALNNYLQICDGVNLAAKQLAIARGTDTDNCATAATTVAGATTGLNTAYLSSPSLTMAIKIGGTSYGSSCTGAMASTSLKGETATLTVTYPCHVVLGITSSVGTTFLSGCTLSAYTEELIQ